MWNYIFCMVCNDSWSEQFTADEWTVSLPFVTYFSKHPLVTMNWPLIHHHPSCLPSIVRCTPAFGWAVAVRVRAGFRYTLLCLHHDNVTCKTSEVSDGKHIIYFFPRTFKWSLLTTTLQDSSRTQLICPFIYHNNSVIVIMKYRSRQASVGGPLLHLDGGNCGGLQY